MGELDLIKPILEGRGEVHFGRVNLKPGKPLTFATVIVGLAIVATAACLLPALRTVRLNPVAALRRE